MASVRTSGTAIGDRVTRRLPAALVLGVGVLALAGCAQADRPQSTIDPKGDYAQKIFNLSWPVFLIAGIVGVIVFVTLIVTFVRFRERPGHMETPKQMHGNPALEIGLTILPAVLLAVIAVPTIKILFELNATPKDPLVVNVFGQQWWWEFDYPSIKGADNLPLVTANEMVIPAGRQVQLNITSRDVIHSFWIPKLNGKRDAVPGRVQTLEPPGRPARRVLGSVHRVLRPLPHQHAHAGHRADAGATSTAGWRTSSRRPRPPPDRRGQGGRGAVQEPVRELPPGERAARTPNGEQIVAQPQTQVYSGAAPNLTHLMSRGTFASANFDLLSPDCRAARDKLNDNDPIAFSAAYLKGTTPECLNQPQLEAWLRNPPAILPEFVNPTKLAATDGKYRGMPNLNLTETQIDQLVAYLQTLNPKPALAGGRRSRWPSSSSHPQPLALAAARHRHAPTAAYGVFRRPVATTGWRSWLFTVDHKKIGIMYGVAALFFFLVGGIEALLIRLQLARPNGKVLSAEHLQPDVHHARHDDDLPLRHADGGRVRQLPGAAADRRPRRGLPPPRTPSASGRSSSAASS